jgi:hypothetical protein
MRAFAICVLASKILRVVHTHAGNAMNCIEQLITNEFSDIFHDKENTHCDISTFCGFQTYANQGTTL